jgi:hypothetical protein
MESLADEDGLDFRIGQWNRFSRPTACVHAGQLLAELRDGLGRV